ncbi:MAG: tetratricopeptide repeat protein, partial [Deltaproteobacteria bacterium]|nr:tetratricopeptide repeat protein [Deltaproteobacteria bacterium]
ARTGQGRAAAEVLQRAARAFPESVALGLQLAGVLHAEGEQARARAVLEALAAASPADARVWAALGHQIAESGGDPAAAQAHLRRALALQPADARTLAYLSCALRRGGDGDGARALLGQALALDPEEPAVHEHLGDLHHAAGEGREAAEAWGRALRLVEEASDDADAAALQGLRCKAKSPPRTPGQ